MTELKALHSGKGLLSGRLRPRRSEAIVKLNLVSLMDIFTILVFFLMINSSDVQVLQQDKSVVLPESMAERVPGDALIVVVTSQDILVQGKRVISSAALMESSETVSSALKAELDYHAQRHYGLRDGLQDEARAEQVLEDGALPLTIMGDARVPYAVLKRIMATCSETAYRDVSLAVTRVYDADGVALR
ncbi:MAG: biopolymer transporter ExbD [Gammaproteobacteria bacterium]